MRWGEKASPRFIDKNAALALPADAPLPPEWPVPQLVVPPEEIGALAAGQRIGLRPRGGASTRVRRRLQALDLLPRRRTAAGKRGLDVWVVGGPGEKALAQEIVAAGRGNVRDLTGRDLPTASWRWRRPASPSRTISG